MKTLTAWAGRKLRVLRGPERPLRRTLDEAERRLGDLGPAVVVIETTIAPGMTVAAYRRSRPARRRRGPRRQPTPGRGSQH